MRMTKVRALCLSGALFTVLPCAQGSEKDELALVMKQLDQLQASLERAKVVAVQEHTSHRFYFDYPQATDDIAKIKRGISTYLEPSRAQPVLPQDISGQLLWSNLNGHFDRVFSPRQGT
ncbi:RAQPRD family integrative conjugative element protein [Klebsiella pneumoniae]